MYLIELKRIQKRSIFNALKRILNACQTHVKRVDNAFDLRLNEFKTSFFFVPGHSKPISSKRAKLYKILK